MIDALEELAAGRGRALPSDTVAHVDECARCSRRIEELREVHAALATLAPLSPAVGFADAVMRRVRLPLSWRARVLQAVRTHRAAGLAAFASVAVAVAGGGLVYARYPDLTPGALLAFVLDRSAALVWSGIMAAGRLVYDSGLSAAAQGLMEQLTLPSALLALATVSLVGLGALRILLRLLHQPAELVSPRASR